MRPNSWPKYCCMHSFTVDFFFHLQFYMLVPLLGEIKFTFDFQYPMSRMGWHSIAFGFDNPSQLLTYFISEFLIITAVNRPI